MKFALLVLSLAFALTSCNKKEEVPTTPTPTVEAAPQSTQPAPNPEQEDGADAHTHK